MKLDDKKLFRNYILALGALCLHLCLLSIIACSGGGNDSGGQSFDESLLGGDTTVFDATTQAFEFPAPDLTNDGLKKHLDGDAAFDAVFVSAPALVNPGLGPIFNNNSCSACHINNGRGKPDEKLTSMLFRISIPGESDTGGPNPIVGFGTQLQDKALFGTQPEAEVKVEYEEIEGQYTDGTTYTLRKPFYTVTDLYIPIPNDFLLSPRVAPFIFGIGLLEAIPEEIILGLADPDDSDGDGISGRPNFVWDSEKQEVSLGRFGWKASKSSAFEQVADAYNQDMGVTNPLLTAESSLTQVQYDGMDDEPEINFETLDAAAFYVQTLAVPARRNVEAPRVKRGQKLFVEARCSSCHIPSLRTGQHPTRDEPVLNNQTIHPYTDLLLHDMGEGLADGRPDFEATGSEWRTSPLWGIGLIKIVNGHTNFLHDGRARNLEEAILWHGGEAKSSQEFFRNLSAEERGALLEFLNNL
jgi:CxxC motif-containing protein (DUF1111 family)